MTAAEFKVLFPGFALETDARVTAVIALAAPYFDVTRWGTFYSDGLGNWVAHRIVVDNAEAAQSTSLVDAGDATAETFGRISTTRSPELAKMEAVDPYMRTTYGRRYRHLCRLVGLGGVVVQTAACVISPTVECGCGDSD